MWLLGKISWAAVRVEWWARGTPSHIQQNSSYVLIAKLICIPALFLSHTTIKLLSGNVGQKGKMP